MAEKQQQRFVHQGLSERGKALLFVCSANRWPQLDHGAIGFLFIGACVLTWSAG
ncbi:MAG: hypothetical protein GX755_00565 [Syntrophomonadaceae bacterium]|nr:hypothetical protein [Syntrophomonadaceae bacterium]